MMLLNVLSFLLLVQVSTIYGFPDKFVIENQKTGQVLDGAELLVTTGKWANKKSQVWTLEQSSIPGYYVIHNLHSQNALDVSLFLTIITWPKHGLGNQLWKVDSEEDTRLEVKFFANHYLIDDGKNAKLGRHSPGDDSDRWILVEAPQGPLK